MIDLPAYAPESFTWISNFSSRLPSYTPLGDGVAAQPLVFTCPLQSIRTMYKT